MIEYKNIIGTLEDDIITNILDIENDIFGRNLHEFKSFKNDLTSRQKLFSIFAFQKDTLIAFKIGFEKNPNKFHSVLGGVVTGHRQKGIARELMKRQHKWLIDNGYKYVSTYCSNEFKSMLCLNLRAGFDIRGSFANNTGKVRIILEKKLYITSD